MSAEEEPGTGQSHPESCTDADDASSKSLQTPELAAPTASPHHSDKKGLHKWKGEGGGGVHDSQPACWILGVQPRLLQQNAREKTAAVLRMNCVLHELTIWNIQSGRHHGSAIVAQQWSIIGSCRFHTTDLWPRHARRCWSGYHLGRPYLVFSYKCANYASSVADLWGGNCAKQVTGRCSSSLFLTSLHASVLFFVVQYTVMRSHINDGGHQSDGQHCHLTAVRMCHSVSHYADGTWL